MSSHNIWVQCPDCRKSESIYTGDVDLDEFDDEDWEGSIISVRCTECKTKHILDESVEPETERILAEASDVEVSAYMIESFEGLAPTDQVSTILNRGMVVDALQQAWNDFCSDTGCIPDCFQVHGPRTTQVYADFNVGNFASFVCDGLLRVIAQRPQNVLDGVPALDRETLDTIADDVVAASSRTLGDDDRYSHWTARVIAGSMASAILVKLGEGS